VGIPAPDHRVLFSLKISPLTQVHAAHCSKLHTLYMAPCKSGPRFRKFLFHLTTVRGGQL